MWLALGAAGAPVDRARRAAGCAPPRRRRGLRHLHLDQARRRPPAPGDRGPPAPDGHAHRALLPVLALDLVVRRRARVRGALPAAPLYFAAAAMGLSRLYLGVHYPSDVAAGAALGTRSGASADDEGGHRRDAQRGQVLAVQRAQPGGRRGCQLPVHDDRAERRRRAGGGRAARAGGADHAASNIVWDTIEFHDIAGLVAGASKGEGLGNKFLANIRETDALLHVVRTHTDDNVIHPDGRSTRRADIETIETELLSPTSTPPSAGTPGRARRALRRPRRRRRGGVAAPGDRGAAVRAARALRPGARRTRPTRCATCRR